MPIRNISYFIKHLLDICNVNQLEIILQRLEQIESNLTSEKMLLNINEVCILTGISKSTIYKLTSTNQIPHYKRVKQLMFDKREVMEWVKEGRVRTLSELGSDF